MANDSGTAITAKIMRLVNEQDAQSNRFQADVQNRITGMLSRRANEQPQAKASDQMSASQDMKSFIVGYTKAVRDSFKNTQDKIMRDKNNPLLDAPIPGQSLTTEPGNRPWENPPQYVTIEEAIQFYMERFSDPEMGTRVLDILESSDVPITVLVEIITTGGMMQGLHTLDVGILITPVLVEFIAGLADKAGIKYKIGTETTDAAKPELLRAALKEVPDDVFAVDDLLAEEEQPVEEEKEKPKAGLMKRPTEMETA